MVARQKFKLPEVIDPPRRCIEIEIPDDNNHILAFAGLLKELTDWFNWERDSDHKAVLAAHVWEDVFLSIDWNEMSCCKASPPPPMVRIDPDNIYNIQLSYDGGTTWVTNPNQIYNTIMPYSPPVIDDHHTQCDAATNALQHLKDLEAKQHTEMGTDATITEVALTILLYIAAAVAAFFIEGPFSIATEIALFIGAIAAISALGAAAFDGYFSSDVWDTVLCAIYCNIDSSGVMSSGGFSAMLGKLSSALPDSAAKDWLITAIHIMGFDGFQNLLRYGASADADCSSCDCSPCTGIHIVFRDAGSGDQGVLISQEQVEDGWCLLTLTGVNTGSYYDCDFVIYASPGSYTGRGIAFDCEAAGDDSGDPGTLFYGYLPTGTDYNSISYPGVHASVYEVLFERVVSSGNAIFTIKVKAH